MRAEKYTDLATEYGWDILDGTATFTTDGLAEPRYLTSTTATELETLPASMIVIGATRSAWNRIPELLSQLSTKD